MAREQAQYEHCQVVAAEMLEVPLPEERPSPGRPLPAGCGPCWRTAWPRPASTSTPRRGVTGDIIQDGDLFL